jgi:trigger factor
MRALEEHELSPLERPSVDWLPREANQPTLRFKATVSVRPQIALIDYTTIKLDATIPKATDEEIHDAIERLRRETATLVPVERAAQLGDVVVIDYAGSIDGEAFAGGTATSQQVDLLEDRFIPGFAKGIAGLTIGQSSSVEAIFPEQYHETSLAGKTAVFQVKLLEVKEHELPPIDDEFAAKFINTNPSMDTMRKEIAKRIERAHEIRVKNEQADILIEKLLESHEVSLPELLVDRELEAAVRTRQLEVAREGKSWEDYLKEQEKTDEQFRSELTTEAQRRVKTMLIVEEIARKEKISATAAEIDAELTELSNQYGQPKERIREAIGDELHGLADGIVRSKALDLVLDRALGIVTIPE